MIEDLTESEIEVLEVALMSYSEEMYEVRNDERGKIADELLRTVREKQ